MNMMAQTPYQNWQYEEDEHQLIWLGINSADANVNTLTPAALEELSKILEKTLERYTRFKGIIIYSVKPTGFMYGANVETISQLASTSQVKNLLELGQKVFAQLEQFPLPTVAMIEGICLGGGLELILACRYRIASYSPETKFGAPEVLLGFHPGWGGTVRLPKVVGMKSAADLMLTGKTIDAKMAKKINLVNDTVAPYELKRVARYFIERKPPQSSPPFWTHLLQYQPFLSIFTKLTRRYVHKKINPEHYPAPDAILDLLNKDPSRGEEAYQDEVTSVLNLFEVNDTLRNLVRVYFLRERLKKFGKKTDSYDFKYLHVVGAGTMGGDIAAWCASRGLTVTLQDQSLELISKSIKRAYEFFKKSLKNPRAIQEAMDKLIPDPTGSGVHRADIIIEAIYEDIAAKRQLFLDLEHHAKPDAILATNTSTIPLEEISKVLKDPERLVGIHFFNPATKMQLVEVIQAKDTHQKVLEKALVFVQQIARLPLPVKSSPGFLVNRILLPYLLEAMAILEEGIPGPVIDKAAVDFGMPMGPVELADRIGLDVCLATGEKLGQYYGGKLSEQLKQLVAEKKLGVKTSQGFYSYDKNGKPLKPQFDTTKTYPNDIADRLILRMINEAAQALREKVVADADLVDAGMIFGTGFAPFRGGLMHYAQTVGEEQLNVLFRRLEQEHGERFKVKNDQ